MATHQADVFRVRAPGVMRVVGVALAAALAAVGAASAQIKSDLDRGLPVEVLPPPSPHWVWVNDIAFSHVQDGRAHLIDGDSGHYLGELDTGFSFARVVFSRDGTVIYSPETYFARGTRGERVDVVTFYDAKTLGVLGEVRTPPKRSSNLPVMANVALTSDGRFLLTYYFNPAQSVGVVDVARRAFVGEIETPGCALIYPVEERGFFSICSNGDVQLIHLDEAGKVATQERVAKVFEVESDPVTEKAVQRKGAWLFVTSNGRIVPIDAERDTLRAGNPWWLTSDEERKNGWRPGGSQHLAMHERLDRLYVLMRQGAAEARKDPSPEVWVYDLASHRRIQRIKLRTGATSVQVSQDAAPLLYTTNLAASDLDVYDARTGDSLRTIKDVATTPTLLMTP